MLKRGFPVLFMLLGVGPWAVAQTATCDKLEGEPKALAQKLLASQYMYDCCDQSIAECLKAKPTCRLAVRLANNICRRVADKQDEATIVRGLAKRARSMSRGKKYKIDLKPEVAAGVGSDAAKVVLVEYACARCPFCSRLTPLIYKEVVEGRLKDKVRFHFKIFPIRSHEFSKETGLGFMAAITMGRFWPFALHSYVHFDQFCIKQQAAWAKAAGLDLEGFERLIKEPSTRKLLVESKKEGLRNKVDATPAFYINGRKYVGDMDIEELVDISLEEAERVEGLVHVP